MTAASSSTPLRRAVSLAEFLIGSAIVIGHNVYHVVPNEVPILFVLGWLSLRLRDGAASGSGIGRFAPFLLARPKSWWKTIAIAVVAAVLMQLDSVVTEPITNYFWHRPANLSEFRPLIGNLGFAASSLALIWTFAAFGEEISYRGYLLERAADLGRNSNVAYWLAMIAVAVLFGFGHVYKGPAGIFDSAVSGLILGVAYLLSGRNLWAAILAHGLSDTIAVVIVFSGLADNV